RCSGETSRSAKVVVSITNPAAKGAATPIAIPARTLRHSSRAGLPRRDPSGASSEPRLRARTRRLDEGACNVAHLGVGQGRIYGKGEKTVGDLARSADTLRRVRHVGP